MHIEQKGRGEPLVMLHGWGFHGGVWQSVIDELSQHYHLYLIDLPGCGRSPMTSYAHADLVAQLFEHLPESIHLMGWSLGGLIAMKMALKAPQRVNKMITVASSPCFIGKACWPGVDVTILDKFAERLFQNSEKTLKEFLLLQAGNDDGAIRSYKQLKPLLESHPPQQLGLEAGLSVLKNWDLRAEIKALDLPCLSLYGALDAIVSKESAAALQALIPHGEQHIFEKAGHAPFISHPDEFTHQVREFLS